MLTDLFADLLEPTAPAAPAPAPAPAPATLTDPTASDNTGAGADLEADTESLTERAAIMEHDGGLPRDEADYRALMCTRFRVWRLTLDDGTTCIQLDPTAPTVAEFQPLAALAYRVASWEPVALSALVC